jgi:hypothetical protein
MDEDVVALIPSIIDKLVACFKEQLGTELISIKAKFLQNFFHEAKRSRYVLVITKNNRLSSYSNTYTRQNRSKDLHKCCLVRRSAKESNGNPSWMLRLVKERENIGL